MSRVEYLKFLAFIHRICVFVFMYNYYTQKDRHNCEAQTLSHGKSLAMVFAAATTAACTPLPVAACINFMRRRRRYCMRIHTTILYYSNIQKQQ